MNGSISSEDEVGELAAAFNKMTADLKNTLVSRDALKDQIRHRELLTATILQCRFATREPPARTF